MAANNNDVMIILKAAHPKKNDQNLYVTHHDFLDALVKNYLAELKRTREEALNSIAGQQKILSDEQDQLKQDRAALIATIGRLHQAKSADEAGQNEDRAASIEKKLNALSALQNQNAELLAELAQKLLNLTTQQEKIITTIQGHQDRIKALEKIVDDYAISLEKQDKTGTARGRVDEAAAELQKRLMLIQTYKNIEVVILYGMAVPSFLLSIETLIIESAYGDIAFERAGVQLGLVLGVAVSVFMMGIAAFLRRTLRHDWEVKVDLKLADYKKSLNEFLKTIKYGKNESQKQEAAQNALDVLPKELEELIETNVTYARKNWAPFPEPVELDLVGFRTNALHDGKDQKSDERIRHGERKDAWAFFYRVECVAALVGGGFLSLEVHTQKARADDVKPDLPDFVTPKSADASSASSSRAHGMDFMGPEFVIIALASIALLAAVAAFINKSRQSSGSGALRFSKGGNEPATPPTGAPHASQSQ